MEDIVECFDYFNMLPAVQRIIYPRTQMSIGKEIADKLKIMTYMTFIILFVNIFVGMSTICWPMQMILYSVMVILYVVFTVLQILIHFKYRDL